jgi:hypothetical protein
VGFELGFHKGVGLLRGVSRERARDGGIGVMIKKTVD